MASILLELAVVGAVPLDEAPDASTSFMRCVLVATLYRGRSRPSCRYRASAQMRCAQQPVAPQVVAFIRSKRLVLRQLALPESRIERVFELARRQHVVAEPATDRYCEPLLAARKNFLRQQ